MAFNLYSRWRKLKGAVVMILYWLVEMVVLFVALLILYFMANLIYEGGLKWI